MAHHKEQEMPAFEVVGFEIQAVYGAHFDIPSDATIQKRWMKWFESRKRETDPEKIPIREGWTPIYRDHCSTVTVDIRTPEWCEKIEVEHPIFFEVERGSLPHPTPIIMNVSRQLTVRKDGFASITIRLKAEKRKVPYNLSDILAPLLLAPRIHSGKKLGEVKSSDSQMRAKTISEVYKKDADDEIGNESRNLLDSLSTEDKSPLFLLFLGALKEVVSAEPFPDWCEYYPFKLHEITGKGYNNGERCVPEILPWVGDQQIPYFVVFATLPGETYNSAFLEEGADLQKHKLSLRRPYTRPLAAILQRWLSPHNASFVSIDFLESLGLLKEGAFVNKYTNSLSFVTYCSTGTICLRPELDNGHSHCELDPQEATYGSILRCVELSRLRWHHALRLNRWLDDLTERVIRHKGTQGFENYLAELLSIRAESALQFLDPLTYQWDAAVGSDIAKFLQIGVIEHIESECIQKLNMVKELIHEKLDLLRAGVMRGKLKKEQ